MSIRNIMWTALPNGFNPAGDKLHLSVYISPRLVTDNGTDGVLKEFFPDLKDWPATVGHLHFKVEIQGGPSFDVGRVPSPALESDLWTALFKPDTFVRSSKPEDKTDLKIRSYPVRKVSTFLKQTYQTVAVQAGEFPPTREQLGFGDGQPAIVDLTGLAALGTGRARAPEQVEQALEHDHALAPEFGDTQTDFYQLKTFHEFLSKRLPDGTPAPLAAQTLPKLDFHQVVSRLSQYPELERRMGLVVDLEIPATIPASGNVRVVPSLGGVAPMTTWTAYRLDAAGRRFLAAGGPGSDVDSGMLLLSANNYDIVDVDIDGAAQKMLDFAFNVGRLNTVSTTAGSPTNFGLPSLRSAGLAATRVARAVRLRDRFTAVVAQNQAIAASPQNGPVLTAEDVTRGYRVDVWDSLSGNWHSLCWRDGRYTFLNPHLVRHLPPDEGFISLATTHSADGTTTDLHLPESLFRWAGWSLSVPRIGRTVGSNSQAADQENPAQTEFKLETLFRAVKGTLPRLRFGASYQFRARAVDLAGNSLAPDDKIDATFSIPAQPAPYLRYEPIAAPVVILRDALGETTTPGESIERIVIRSNFNTPAAGPSERHVAPVKVSQETAEVHGMFDTPAGLDKTIYPTLVNKDGDFGSNPAHPDQPLPHPEAQVVLPYLPDPLSPGAGFFGLPGTADNAFYSTPFSGKWPDERPFRLVLVEGSGAPVFTEDASERVLTVQLAKAEVAPVRLVSYLAPDGLDRMAIWDLIVRTNPPSLPLVRQFALEGRHWMLTPPRTLTLVHAVQQPLLDPQFQSLASVRTLGGTKARLQDDIPISGKSTIKVDINAAWNEMLDDGSDDVQPKTPSGEARAFELPVDRHAIRLPIDGFHEFHDTKYRSVTYTAVATSCFREYFPNSMDPVLAPDFTRASDPLTIDILNTARPAAPKVLYVVPTFGWGEKTEGTWSVSTRAGGGLRVYLDRPWYSSGEGELLGVVLWGCSPPQHNTFAAFETPDFLKPYVTQWGMDPIWPAEAPPSQATPLPEHFLNAVAKQSGLTLEELADRPNVPPISVAGHEVGWDNDRKLWYCDLELDPGIAYFPFIRMALARFQPKSLPDAHLSRVVLADFAQLVPGRSASIAFDGYDPTLLHVAITGLLHRAAGQSAMQITVETQPPGAGNLAWTPVSIVALTPAPGPGATTLWTSPITLPDARGSRPFRLRIEEFEIYPTGTGNETQNRLVYADVLVL